jgi:hypothetical protein
MRIFSLIVALTLLFIAVYAVVKHYKEKNLRQFLSDKVIFKEKTTPNTPA